ncbi:MAG: amidohydrolase [Acidimicrobiales bacterium]
MSDLGLTGPRLDEWLSSRGEELVAFRRHLHTYPERSGEEHATTELIAERLRVAGLTARVLSCGTGLMCDVGPAPRVALRADIDALAMQDAKHVSYRSQHRGVAHACGHDVHTAVVLGAGLYLAHHWPEEPAGLRLIFQPAEERLPGGALDVIADDGLDGVERLFGVHCDPKLGVGQVGLRAGPITSAADMVVIELSGPGGHTARPEQTVDMVALAARVVAELPDRVRRHLGPEAPIRLVFGALHAGDAPNVIPTHAELRASVRTPLVALWDVLPAVVEAELHDLVDGKGASCALRYTRGVPPVTNDAGAIEEVRRGVVEVLGQSAVTEAIQSWGGDDFAWYTQRIPSAYVRLGTHDPADDSPRLDLHAGLFDVDERAIGVGVRVLVAAVEQHLEARRR